MAISSCDYDDGHTHPFHCGGLSVGRVAEAAGTGLSPSIGPKLCDFYVQVYVQLCAIGFFLSDIWLLFF
jgi:hypothetical protein